MVAIARDATEIEAREKPVQNKANDGKDDPPAPDNPAPPRKRGPRKDEQRPKPTRLKRQVTHNLSQMLADLPTACDVDCNKTGRATKRPGCYARNSCANGRGPRRSVGGLSRCPRFVYM
jgi:hypothetical protein